MTSELILFASGLMLGGLSIALVLLSYRFVWRWWHNRRYGKPIEHGMLLVSYGRRLIDTKDQDTLSQLMTQDVAAELDVKQSILLLPQAHQLATVNETRLSLPINHAAVRWVSSSGEAQRSDKGRLNELILQGRTDLSWTRVWVPLMRGVGLEGMWLLGARAGDMLYSPEDLHWLTSIAREAAAVLDVLHFAEQERKSTTEIRTLYRQLVSAREMERGRLSRELHDGVLQDLCAVTRDLKAVKTLRDSDDQFYTDLVKLSDGTVQSIRAICNDLRPPLLQQDLALALRTLVEEIDTRSFVPVHIDIHLQKDELHLPDDTALAIFRITQEALNNSLQHADASEVAIRLTEYPDRLRLTITDDGQGIPGSIESASFLAGGHYGIAGMRERANMIGGKLDVQTSLGYGTVVILELAF